LAAVERVSGFCRWGLLDDVAASEEKDKDRRKEENVKLGEGSKINDRGKETF